MKSTLKGFAKVWLIIGGAMTAADAIGFTLCKVLEKIGKPWKSLSTAYNEIYNYKSVPVVIYKWLVMFFAWPITIVASWVGDFIYKNKDEGV